MKKIIIINGKGYVGKDEIANTFGKKYNVENVSSIDNVKDAAKILGWNGDKDDKSRKFLADLKQLNIEYNNYPFHDIINKYHEFMNNDNQDILFIHIREPEEIEKMKKQIPHAITLLIKRSVVDNRIYGNAADDNVDNYDYDMIYQNDEELEISMQKLLDLFEEKFMGD